MCTTVVLRSIRREVWFGLRAGVVTTWASTRELGGAESVLAVTGPPPLGGLVFDLGRRRMGDAGDVGDVGDVGEVGDVGDVGSRGCSTTVLSNAAAGSSLSRRVGKGIARASSSLASSPWTGVRGSGGGVG